MLISETHFTHKNYLKIPNYSIYDTKFPTGKARGGTAIIIKSNIRHYENEKNMNDYLQATSVTLEDVKGLITLTVIYCPPKHIINTEMFSKFFESLGHRFIAAGDYNAKHPWWGSRSSSGTPRGRQLYATIQSLNLFPISTGEPTYWPTDKNKTPDLLDFAVVKGINPDCFTATSCLDLSSDHSPVIISFKQQIKMIQKTPHLYNKNTDWEKYKEYLNNNLNCNISLKSIDELENAIEEFNIQIHNAAKEATTSFEHPEKQYNIAKHILEKIREKRQLRKIWQIYKSKHIKTKLNKSIKDLKTLLIEEKNNSIQNYLQNLTANEATEYSLWKATKKLKRQQKHIPPIRKSNGDWARSESEKLIHLLAISVEFSSQ